MFRSRGSTHRFVFRGATEVIFPAVGTEQDITVVQTLVYLDPVPNADQPVAPR
jgi:hypothetical protein